MNDKTELLLTKWNPIKLLYNTMQNIVYYYLYLLFLSLKSDKERKVYKGIITTSSITIIRNQSQNGVTTDKMIPY